MLKISARFSFTQFFLLICCFTLLMPNAKAIDYGKAFASGLTAFQQKDYDQAIKFYEEALSSEMKSAELYNNLGLAYYEKGDFGFAVLNFERAIRQNPYLRDARHNLKATKERMPIQIKAPKRFWLFNIWNSVVCALSSNSWAILLWASLFSALAAFVVWYNKLMAPKKNALAFKLGLSLAIFSIFPLIWGFQASKLEHNKDNIIVISTEAGVRTNPSLEGEDIMLVGAGTKGRIMEQKGEWNRIRLENGVLGWMPKKLMERI